MDLGWHKIHHNEEAARRKWQNPEATLQEIGLKTGQVFIDMGCGDGFFTIPAARTIGNNGRVYGLDVDSEAIKCLREKAQKEDLANPVLKVGEAEAFVFCEGCADFVFFGNVLHDFKNPFKVLVNVKKMLKPAGCLVDVDWKKEQTDFGPPATVRFSEQEAVGLIRRAGFRIDAVTKSGAYHYIVTAHTL
jgi:ubiquinone/menaquinone biosynthesis C-methylase UbiE